MPQLYLIALAVAAALAAGAASGWKVRDLAAAAEVSKLRAACADRESVWERAARESEARERAKETAWRAATDKEVEDVRQDATKDAARAAVLRTVNARLLDRVARLAADADRCGRVAAPAAGGASAAGPGLVLADMYRSADAEATELAAFADAARRAGLACERIYDAVKEERR